MRNLARRRRTSTCLSRRLATGRRPTNNLGSVTSRLVMRLPTSVRSSSRRSVSTSGSSGTLDGCHVVPVGTSLQLYVQGDAQLHRTHHDPAEVGCERTDLGLRGLED